MNLRAASDRMNARTMQNARTSPLSASAARCAVAIARRNYEHAKDAADRAETARRLAAAALAAAVAEAGE